MVLNGTDSSNWLGSTLLQSKFHSFFNKSNEKNNISAAVSSYLFVFVVIL